MDTLQVLVVDADRMSAAEIVEFLEAGGYRAESTDDHAAAASLVATRAYNVAFIDVDAEPDSVAELILALEKGSPAIQIIALSDGNSVPHAVQAFRAGACDLLIKPLQRGELRYTMGRCQARVRQRFEAERDEISRDRESGYAELAARAFEHSLEGMVITDERARILAVNRAFTEITGYSLGEVMGRAPAILKSGRHDAEFYSNMWHALIRAGRWQGEVWNRRKSGDVYPEWLSISAVYDSKGTVTNYIGVFTDITERKGWEEALVDLAHHDALTELPNRLLLGDRLAQACARADRESRCVGVLFGDLDRFKHINDTLGHAAGDAFLQEVGRRLTGAVRKIDTVARVGGDEFTVVIPDLGPGDEARAEIARIAEKLITVVEQPFERQQQRFQVSVSLGAAIYPLDGRTSDELMRYSDAAMYRAKSDGGGRFCYYSAEEDGAVAAAAERMTAPASGSDA